MQNTTDAAELVHTASGHAHALARISAHTGAGLLAIAGVLGIDHLPGVQRSVQRERRLTGLYRALERDLQRVAPPTPSGAGVRLVGGLPRLELLEAHTRGASGISSWDALITLRQWNLRQHAKHRAELHALAEVLVPALQAGADPDTHAAASRLLECHAASRYTPR